MTITDLERRPPLAVIFAVTLVGVSTNPLVTPALPEIIPGVGGSTTQAGLILAAGTLPAVILAPLIGLVADRYGRRRALIPCLLLFACSGGAVAVASDLWTLLGLRFLQGIGAAGLTNLATVLIGDHWSGPARARIIGQNIAVLTVGLALFPVVGGLLAEAAGWQALFLVYIVGVVPAWMVWRWVPATAPREVAILDQLRAVRPLIAKPEVGGSLAATFLLFGLLFAIHMTVIPFYLQDTFGATSGQRGFVLALPAVSNALAALLSGRLQRRGPRGVLTAGSLVLAAAFAGCALAPTLALFSASLVLMGAAMGLLIPPMQNVTVTASTEATRGSLFAMYASTMNAGKTVGPALGSTGMSTVGSAAAMGLGAVVAFTAMLPLAWLCHTPSRRPGVNSRMGRRPRWSGR